MGHHTIGTSDELASQLRSARQQGGAFLLPPQCRVRVSGADAFRYLNGQVTRDLRRLVSGEAMPACLLTAKGKLSVAVLIHRDGDDLVVEADPRLEESLMARLDRYIVADHVNLSVEPACPILHLFGSDAADAPANALRVRRLGVPGCDLEIVESSVLPRLLDPRVIEALRIERLLPVWDRELNGETLPPEVGFDRTHIDYDRGCYPGQETISRIKSIGRVNRLLCRLDPSPGSIPNPEGNLSAGMPLLNEKGNEISVITSASFQWDTGAWVALAILPRALFENREPLFAFDPLTGDKTPLSIVEIPGS